MNTTKRILVIDDLRIFDPEPGEVIVTYRNIYDAAYPLFNEDWDEVWLDHDLSGDQTIRELVSAIEEMAYNGEPLLRVGKFVLITDNTVGRDWMATALTPYYPVEIGDRKFRVDWDATPA